MSHFPSAPPPGAYVPPNQSTPPAQGFNPPKPQYGYQQAQASSSYGTPTQNHGPSSVSASNKPANAFGQAFDQAVKQGKPMFNKLGKTISSKLGNKPLTSTPQHLQSYDSFQQHNQPPAYQAQTQHTGQQAQQQNAYHSPQQSPFPQSNYVTPNSGHLGQNNYFDQQTPASPNPLPQANAGYNSNAFGQSGDAGGHLQGHYNQGQPQSPYQQSQAGPHSGQQTGVIGGSQAPPQFVNPPSPHIHNAPSTQPSTQTTNQQQWSPPSLPQHPGQVSSPVTQQQSFSTAPPPPNQSQPQQWIQHHQESSNPTPPPHQSQPQQQWTQHQQQSSNLAPTPPPPPPTQSQQQWTPHHQGSSNPTPPPHQHNAPPPVPLHPNQQQQQTWPQISPAINSPVSPPVSHALPQPSTVYQQPSANAPNEAHKPSQPSTPAPLAGQPQAAPTEFYAELPADLGNLSLDNSKPQSPSDAAASSPYHAYRPAGSDTQSPRPGFTVPRRAVSTSSLHLADPWRFADAVTELPTREFFIIANLLYEALDRKFEPNGTGLLEASKMLESWKVLGFAEEAAQLFAYDNYTAFAKLWSLEGIPHVMVPCQPSLMPLWSFQPESHSSAIKIDRGSGLAESVHATYMPALNRAGFYKYFFLEMMHEPENLERMLTAFCVDTYRPGVLNQPDVLKRDRSVLHGVAAQAATIRSTCVSRVSHEMAGLMQNPRNYG